MDLKYSILLLIKKVILVTLEEELEKSKCFIEVIYWLWWEEASLLNFKKLS
jgi:hypothetical protein